MRLIKMYTLLFVIAVSLISLESKSDEGEEKDNTQTPNTDPKIWSYMENLYAKSDNYFYIVIGNSVTRSDNEKAILTIGDLLDPVIIPYMFPESTVAFDAYTDDGECISGCYFIHQIRNGKKSDFWIRLDEHNKISWIRASGDYVFDDYGNGVGMNFADLKDHKKIECFGEYYSHCDVYGKDVKYLYEILDSCQNLENLFYNKEDNRGYYLIPNRYDCLKMTGFMIFDNEENY